MYCYQSIHFWDCTLIDRLRIRIQPLVIMGSVFIRIQGNEKQSTHRYVFMIGPSNRRSLVVVRLWMQRFHYHIKIQWGSNHPDWTKVNDSLIILTCVHYITLFLWFTVCWRTCSTWNVNQVQTILSQLVADQGVAWAHILPYGDPPLPIWSWTVIPHWDKANSTCLKIHFKC